MEPTIVWEGQMDAGTSHRVVVSGPDLRLTYHLERRTADAMGVVVWIPETFLPIKERLLATALRQLFEGRTRKTDEHRRQLLDEMVEEACGIQLGNDTLESVARCVLSTRDKEAQRYWAASLEGGQLYEVALEAFISHLQDKLRVDPREDTHEDSRAESSDDLPF